MFEDQATVSATGDIYSFGMTILQVGSENFFFSSFDEILSFLPSCLHMKSHTTL